MLKFLPSLANPDLHDKENWNFQKYFQSPSWRTICCISSISPGRLGILILSGSLAEALRPTYETRESRPQRANSPIQQKTFLLTDRYWYYKTFWPDLVRSQIKCHIEQGSWKVDTTNSVFRCEYWWCHDYILWSTDPAIN